MDQVRQIKFRGLSIDKREWVYGVPYTIAGNEHDEQPEVSCIIKWVDWDGTCGFMSPDNNAFVSVIPRTVCQFTGLHDKNGKEVYEGDIRREEIEYDDGDELMYFVCVWFVPMSAFVWMSFGDTITNWDNNTDDEPPFALDPLEQHLWTIVGNIHEHPELLK